MQKNLAILFAALLGIGLATFQAPVLSQTTVAGFTVADFRVTGATGFSGGGGPGEWASAVGGRGVIADANGDGFGDLIYSDGTQIFVRYANGSGFGSPTYVGADTAGCLMPNADGNCLAGLVPGFGVGDVNGDGKADIVAGTGVVYLSTGGGFQNAGYWAVPAPNFSAWPFKLADFNGDGLADIVKGSGGNISVAYSTGTSFGGWTIVATDMSGCSGYSDAGCTGYYGKFAAGDVDGDGRADLVLGSGQVLISNGAGFSSAGNWVSGLSLPQQFDLLDVDGDGRADLVYNAGPNIYVQRSTGVGFGAMGSIGSDSTGCAAPGEFGCQSHYAIFAGGDFMLPIGKR
jgi:hypothetical protein